MDEGADVKTFGRTLPERRIQETSGWPVPVTVCQLGRLPQLKRVANVVLICWAWERGRVLIVTSDFHTRRALATFQRTLPTISFSVAAAASDFGSEPWWSFHAALRTIEEWGGYCG